MMNQNLEVGLGKPKLPYLGTRWLFHACQILVYFCAESCGGEREKNKELQDNVAAVNFTPSSKLGKMLMAKCRTLQEENEEIGAMASEGKASPFTYSCLPLVIIVDMLSD